MTDTCAPSLDACTDPSSPAVLARRRGRVVGVRGDGPRWAARHFAVCVVFLALCLNSDSGRITPDTKIDLVTDPGRFLSRALTLWDPQGFAGQLQNQAYGYLFPMGPFFWLNHQLGVPGWVAQRLWWTVLLSVAYLGVVRLARALSIGTPMTRMIAGIAYAASPHVLTLLGANSIESLPMCIAPWIVLPLVRGTSGLSAPRAGLACGLAIFCMGGVNAAANFAAVLPAALFLLTRSPGRRATALAGWAVVGGVLATFWWLVPLALLGRYSPPFLDYIENGATTTTVTSLVESLRGTADWVAYLPGNGWHAGLVLLTEPVVIVNTIVVTAAGLAGVAAIRSTHRGWLLTCLAAGLVALTFGHAGDVGSLFADGQRSLLDTALAPVRNVHKFDVLIRLPLVLGLADLLPRLATGRTAVDKRRASVLIHAVAAIAVAGAATPLVGLGLANSGSYTDIPGYWRQAASWLGAHSGEGRTLLTPASTTPSYVWGTPTDEPLQPLARSAWEVRNNNPYSGPGHVRVLDTVDDLLGTGVAQPQLASYLARTGVRFLAVRNDLDYRKVGSIAPAVVQATLAASPGLTRVTSFGPQVGVTGDYSYSVDQGLQPSQRAVDIWRVAGTGDPRVTSTGSLARLSGGPESVAQLGADAPATVLSGSAMGGARPAEVVLTDGLRRREVSFGGASGQHSVTLAAGEQGPIGRRVPDFLPVAGEQHQSVVSYLGARSVTASSSAADAVGFVAVEPDRQPWSAFDGDVSTTWHSAAGTDPVGQWVQVRYARPVATGAVSVLVPGGITAITMSTSAGSRDLRVPTDGVVVARPVGKRTDHLRITVAAVRAGYFGAAKIADVRMAGTPLARTVVAPRDLPTGRPVDVISFASPGDARTGCLLIDATPQCVAGRARGSEDGAGLDRTFTLNRAASYTPAIMVQPRAGAALTALLAARADYVVTADASSQAVPDPLAGAQTVVDGDGNTGWIADPDDRDPSVTLRFGRPVALSSLRFVTTPLLAATRPDVLRISSASGSRRAAIDAKGTARFATLRAATVTLHLGSRAGLRRVLNTSIAGRNTVGIGVAEVVVPGVAITTRLATATIPVSLPCGSGPTVTIDGRTRTSRVDTTVDQLRNLRPVRAVVCGADRLELDAGPHRVVIAGSPVWTTPTLGLTRRGLATDTSVSPTVRVTDWGRTDRAVAVGARTSTSIVIVNENANAGWSGRFSGRAVRTVTVDGWRQGYVVPAGAAGTLELDFTPQRTYSAALVVGGAAALLLVVALLVLRRRPAPMVQRLVAARVPRPLALTFGGVVGLLVGGPVGLIVAVTTVAGLVVAARVLRPRPWVRVLPAAVAASAFGVAGMMLAAQPLGSLDYLADTAAVQVLCLVAVTAAMLPGRETR